MTKSHRNKTFARAMNEKKIIKMRNFFLFFLLNFRGITKKKYDVNFLIREIEEEILRRDRQIIF